MLKETEAVPQCNWMKMSLFKALRIRVKSKQDVVNPPNSIQIDAIKDTPEPVWIPSNSEPIWVPGFRPRANFSIDSNVCNSTRRPRKPNREHGKFIPQRDLDYMGIVEMLEDFPESDLPQPKVVIAGSTGRVERGFILGQVCVMSPLGGHVG